MKNIVITGACGQIAYSLIFSLIQGFLIKTKFNLKLLDITPMLSQLEGLKMEIEDTASPLVNQVTLTDDPQVAFKEGDYFFFLGAFPRGPGMERRDLLEKNSQIFIKQGEALNLAAAGAKVLVVGNPCNTNAYILHKKLKRKDILITSMSMLDHLRAQHFLASLYKVAVENIENIIIWGNHSKSLFVDTHYATLKEDNLYSLLKADHLEAKVQEHTQKRGEMVIKARGKSSAASAANAALEHMKALIKPSNQFFSCGIYSANNPYGIDKDLFFSMPCIINASGNLEIVGHLDISSYREHLEPSIKELQEERHVVLGLL
jgi:malate dehydrogenase